LPGKPVKLPERLRIPGNIPYAHAKLRPAPLEIAEKALRLFAKRATWTDKNLEIGLSRSIRSLSFSRCGQAKGDQ
jgi:hypothetical protein